MNSRKDVHRPGMIDPSEYEYLFSFSYPGETGFGYNLGMMTATRTGQPSREPIYEISELGQVCISGWRNVVSPWGKVLYFDKPNGAGGCDICGARFIHGDVWRKAGGEAIIIGHICGSKMGFVTERGEWTRNQKRMAQLKKDAEYIARCLELKALRRLDAVEFLEANPGLEGALGGDHYILRDLAAKLGQYGSLSPKQVALALKIAADLAAPKGEELPDVTPPSGRTEIEGLVVGTKSVETTYGDTLKMLVQVETAAGKFRLFGTAPAKILDENYEAGGELRGKRVHFTASVEPKESGFGFFSRPTAARLLLAA